MDSKGPENEGSVKYKNINDMKQNSNNNQNNNDFKEYLSYFGLNFDKDSENGDLVCKTLFMESLKDISYTYQYLDHPADVILLGEGKTIKKALESVCVSMFNYMCDLSYVDTIYCKKMFVSGKGLHNFLYHLLDECLYLYSSEYFIAKHVLIMEDITIPSINSENEINDYEFNFNVISIGDYYNRNIHKCGTEIKAITMHYLCFNILINDKWYEYKNDLESQDYIEDLLKALKEVDNKIDMCKVFVLVDI